MSKSQLRPYQVKCRNFVAKYDYLVNKAVVFVDRKKATKCGKVKHKNQLINS